MNDLHSSSSQEFTPSNNSTSSGIKFRIHCSVNLGCPSFVICLWKTGLGVSITKLRNSVEEKTGMPVELKQRRSKTKDGELAMEIAPGWQFIDQKNRQWTYNEVDKSQLSVLSDEDPPITAVDGVWLEIFAYPIKAPPTPVHVPKILQLKHSLRRRNSKPLSRPSVSKR